MRITAAATVTALAAAAALLAGCSGLQPGDQPGDTPSATPSATSWVSVSTGDQVSLSGAGHVAQKVRVPDGAHSLIIDIECTAPGTYRVSTGDAFEFSGSGDCGQVSSVVLPIPNYGTIVLDVLVADDGAFSLTGEFDEDDHAPDVAIAEQCAALSVSSTFIHNAEDGFKRGEIDTAAWTALVAQAATALQSVPTAGSAAIAEQLPTLRDAYARTDLTPGVFWNSTYGDPYGQAADLVARACDSNGSPIVIQAAYGG